MTSSLKASQSNNFKCTGISLTLAGQVFPSMPYAGSATFQVDRVSSWNKLTLEKKIQRRSRCIQMEKTQSGSVKHY